MYLPTYLPCRANREANELSPTATTTKVCNVGRQHSVEAMACVTVDMIDSRTDRWESGLESRYSASANIARTHGTLQRAAIILGGQGTNRMMRRWGHHRALYRGYSLSPAESVSSLTCTLYMMDSCRCMQRHGHLSSRVRAQ